MKRTTGALRQRHCRTADCGSRICLVSICPADVKNHERAVRSRLLHGRKRDPVMNARWSVSRSVGLGLRQIPSAKTENSGQRNTVPDLRRKKKAFLFSFSACLFSFLPSLHFPFPTYISSYFPLFYFPLFPFISFNFMVREVCREFCSNKETGERYFPRKIRRIRTSWSKPFGITGFSLPFYTVPTFGLFWPEYTVTSPTTALAGAVDTPKAAAP